MFAFLHLSLFLLFSLSLSSVSAFDPSSNALPESLISVINGDSSILWNASLSPVFYNRDLGFVQRLCGVQGLRHPPNASASFLATSLPSSPLPAHLVKDDPLPVSFDARQRWGAECPSLYDVRNQGNCGSCWAFGAVEAMTDRICIASDGRLQPYLAASDPVSCCAACGDGCNGGTLPEVWQYWVDTGIVTGRAYGDLTSCFPYQFPDCSHHSNDSTNGCDGGEPTAQSCPTTCPLAAYTTPFLSDKSFGLSSYALPTVDAMQRDLLLHGSIEAAFLVYSDFPSYHSGVYHRTVHGEDALGGHAIKVVGWGVEQGVDYWLCVNSWGPAWGDQGMFKIRRGVNECGIEDMAWAGLPALEGGNRK